MTRNLLPLACTCIFAFCGSAHSQGAANAVSSSAVQSASVRGTITNVQTGKPLDSVHIQLVLLLSGNQPPELSYGAMSKTNGSFSIAGVRPGSYLFRLDRYGFLPATDQSNISNFVIVTAGQQLNLTLNMIAEGIISGEVLDEYGDPLPNVIVLAAPLANRQLLGARNTQGATDDQGRFRLTVVPGEYRVKTQFLNHGVGNTLPETRTDGTQPGRFHDVYFPGTPSATDAAVIEVRPGKERNGVTFRLTRSPVLSIGGALSNFQSNYFCGLSVHSGATVDRMTDGFDTQFLQQPDGKFDGRFLLGNLEPGFYRISAHCNSDAGPLFSQTELIELSSANVNGVSLRVAPGLLVTGTLAPRLLWPPSGASPRISLQSLDSMNVLMPLASDVGPDGSFTIKEVPPGGYRVVVEPMPENGFIQSVQNRGDTRTNNTVDISEASTNLKVVISDQGAEISGSLRDSSKKLPQFRGLVFLVPAEEKFKVERAISSRLTGQGKYSFKAVRPGTYRLFAVGRDRLTHENFDDLVNAGVQSGELVLVQPGARITKDLKLNEGEPDAPIQ